MVDTGQVWESCARELGWVWSPDHDGFVHQDHRRPDGRPIMGDDAQDACATSGVLREQDAWDLLFKRSQT